MHIILHQLTKKEKSARMWAEEFMNPVHPDWRSFDSSDAKREHWHSKTNGKPPHMAWYYCDALDRVLSEAALSELKLVLWNPLKQQVVWDIDVKHGTIADCPERTFLRVSMPERFVPHFTADGKAYVLYRAIVGVTFVDFGRLWDGVVPMEERLGASTHTIIGDLRNAVDPTEAPPARGVIREEEKKVAGHAPVPVVRMRPRVLEQTRPRDVLDPTEVPPNETLCPVPDEADLPAPAPINRSSRSAWTVFGGDKPKPDPKPEPDVVPERAERVEGISELEPPVQLPPPRRRIFNPDAHEREPNDLIEDAVIRGTSPAGCIMISIVIFVLIVLTLSVAF